MRDNSQKRKYVLFCAIGTKKCLCKQEGTVALCAWGEQHIIKEYGDKYAVLEDSILNK